MTTPTPRGSKARHRTRLEERLKKKIYRLKKLGEQRRVLPGLMRTIAARIDRLRKKLAA